MALKLTNQPYELENPSDKIIDPQSHLQLRLDGCDKSSWLQHSEHLQDPSNPRTDGCSRAYETAKPYRYTDIREKGQTRILEVQYGQNEDPIVARLVIVELHNCTYQYDAISYTWADENGDDSPSQKMYVYEGGESEPSEGLLSSILISRNCEAVLRRVREIRMQRGRPIRLWVDAVCINQNDIQERGHQVDLTPYIYVNARRTYVYLGDAGPGSDFLLHILAQGPQSAKWTWEFAMQLHHGALAMFSRPYFSRLWVLQEVMLSRDARVLCGNVEVPWVKVHAGLKSLGAKFLQIGEKTIPPLFYIYAPQLKHTQELITLLKSSRRCQATDPRDKIFGLLGMVRGAETSGLQADYSLSIEKTYIDIARYLITEKECSAEEILGNINMSLKSCQHINLEPETTGEPSSLNLPSWVPDWSQTGPPLIQGVPEMSRERVKFFLREIKLSCSADDESAVYFDGAILGSLRQLKAKGLAGSVFWTSRVTDLNQDALVVISGDHLSSNWVSKKSGYLVQAHCALLLEPTDMNAWVDTSTEMEDNFIIVNTQNTSNPNNSPHNSEAKSKGFRFLGLVEIAGTYQSRVVGFRLEYGGWAECQMHDQHSVHMLYRPWAGTKRTNPINKIRIV